MNVQPKPSFDEDSPITDEAQERRVPGGPRAYTTWPRPEVWPVELEVEPWRP